MAIIIRANFILARHRTNSRFPNTSHLGFEASRWPERRKL
jgi:hypothetical protein